jgi:hypothetical protein
MPVVAVLHSPSIRFIERGFGCRTALAAASPPVVGDSVVVVAGVAIFRRLVLLDHLVRLHRRLTRNAIPRAEIDVAAIRPMTTCEMFLN